MKLTLVFIFVFMFITIKAETNTDEIKRFVNELDQPRLKELMLGTPWIPDDLNLRSLYKKFLNSILVNESSRGLSTGALTLAFKFYENKKEDLKINDDYMIIINYTLPRLQKRFFLLNLSNASVESFMVAHGKLSNNPKTPYQPIPNSFSDTINSHKTANGFCLTKSRYCSTKKTFGECKNRYLETNAMKLDGVSSTTLNSKARAIVMHGATYVSDEWVGNSFGCPALSLSNYDYITQILSQNTLLYHYTNLESKEFKKQKQQNSTLW